MRLTSRFATAFWEAETVTVVGRTGQSIRTSDPLVLRILDAFSTSLGHDDTSEALSDGESERWSTLVTLLGDIGALVPVQGPSHEERDDCWWAPHDFLFHHYVSGAEDIDRIVGSDEPLPAIKPPMSRRSIVLPRTLDAPQASLRKILQDRRSIREFGTEPMDLDLLGQFLELSSRNTSAPIRSHDSHMDVVTRPYPSAGACHPLEVYPVFSEAAVNDVPAGVYHYCPARHELEWLSSDPKQVKIFVKLAATQAGLRTAPIAFFITARQGRVSWKYHSIAYALVLRDVGCLFQTYYLVATLLDLAPCALGGIGKGTRNLARLGGFDPLSEPVVGGFLLGPKALET